MAVTDADVNRVAASVAAQTLQAANRNRRGLMIFNDSTSSLFVKFGTGASSTDFTVKVLAGGFVNLRGGPIYTGIVTGIWSVANGAAQVTETFG